MNKPEEPIYDPGKGKRTPAAWGNWLLSKMGLQRQMLTALQDKPMYHGTANRNKVAKRRAKNKVARRQRAINRHR